MTGTRSLQLQHQVLKCIFTWFIKLTHTSANPPRVASNIVASGTPGSMEDFLNQLNLTKYWDVFARMGFDTLDTLQDLSEKVLEEMEVATGHQGRILRKALQDTLSSSVELMTKQLCKT